MIDNLRRLQQLFVDSANAEFSELFKAIADDFERLTTERDAALAQVEQLRKIKLDEISNELIFETERAIKQRDEYLKTGISTASHGGSHDTCFGFILNKHFGSVLNKTPAQCLAEVKAQAYEEGGAAQKAFWDGFERGAIKGAENIRRHWNEYLQLRQQAKETL